MRRLIVALALAIAPAFTLSQNAWSYWAINHAPAAAAQATISRAADPAARHVAKTVTVCVAAAATAQTPLQFSLRDGATGAGTILWTVRLSAAVNSAVCESASVTIIGTLNTAMTLESAAAPVAGAFAMVSLNGYDL